MSKEYPDYELMVGSAVRYALGRKSYIVGVTQQYIKKNWKSLTKMHWCILRDIRNYIESPTYLERENDFDLTTWKDTYNELITMECTNLDSNWEHLRTPL